MTSERKEEEQILKGIIKNLIKLLSVYENDKEKLDCIIKKSIELLSSYESHNLKKDETSNLEVQQEKSKQKNDPNEDVDLALVSYYDQIGRDKDATDDNSAHNPRKHDQESRLKITQLFLKGCYKLVILTFLFVFFYNYAIAGLNYLFSFKGENGLEYLDVITIISLILTTLSSSVGFVIGFYFKNNNDNQ